MPQVGVITDLSIAWHNLELNALFGGRLVEIFAECGCLEKFLRVVAETPLLQLIEDVNPCQESGRTRVPH